MDKVYVTVSSEERPWWADSFLLERDHDPNETAKERYPEIKNIKVQVCEVTKLG
jgi:hypothetical protein